MPSFKEKFYLNAPHFLQNIIVTLYNYLAYKQRYSGTYQNFLKHYKDNSNLSLEELKTIQEKKYTNFIKFAQENSLFYKELFKNIESPEKLENIEKLPVINKENLRKNINSIYTLKKEKAVVSKTGGTTGKSLEVIYDPKDIEERFSILDNFRGSFGYKLGEKTAWFSGKNLLNKKDIKKNRFWKTDYLYHVRYYSTFHIHTKYLKHYLKNLIKFKPAYMVGFPSTMYEIAKYGMNNNIDFPANTVKAIFPTAETITQDIRLVLEGYFKTDLYNQYASSEGAPFIIECSNKKLHLELQSGVFEVLDENNDKSRKGRLVVTSFNTHGTPLIRYDIGDQIELSDESCNCGNNNPLVKEIHGRISDYIYSEETGKVNLGNISNCMKGVKGVLRFQIQQEVKEKIVVLIEKDHQLYNAKNEATFLKNLRDRLGNSMLIDMEYVSEIPVEKSGKFRIVKNTLKL